MNKVRCVWMTGYQTNRVRMFGFEQDVRSSLMLFTSLMLHSSSGMMKVQGMNRKDTIEQRKNFLLGYKHRIVERLEEANRTAETQAESEYGGGVALVLRDKMDRVNDQVKDIYPRLEGMRVSGGYGSGYGAGKAHANNAGMGQAGIGGRKAIGS